MEMRVRIAVELAMNDELYLDDTFLSEGTSQKETSSVSHTYAMFSDFYTPGVQLSPGDIRSLYERETLDIIKPASYMEMWQLHALASVLGSPVQSVYPRSTESFVTRNLNRHILPRNEMRHDQLLHIMWTSTHSKCYASGQHGNWFQPNHFVPLLQPMSQVWKQMFFDFSKVLYYVKCCAEVYWFSYKVVMYLISYFICLSIIV